MFLELTEGERTAQRGEGNTLAWPYGRKRKAEGNLAREESGVPRGEKTEKKFVLVTA